METMEGAVGLAAVILSLFMPFASIVAVIWLGLAFGQRRRSDNHETLRKALEVGGGSRELLQTIDEITNAGVTDFRKAVIALAVGAAFLAYGLLDGFNVDVMLVAIFPLAIGSAYLFLKLQRDKVSTA